MLYAREVIELMAAYPGREFRKMQIIRYISNDSRMSPKKREAARRAVHRVLESFVETGSIEKRPPAALRGAPVFYVWKSGT